MPHIQPKEALALFDRTLERITATKAALNKLQVPFSAVRPSWRRSIYIIPHVMLAV
jgi:hypothetical protein